MIALVTGATGFIGSHLAESLLEKGIRVRALVRKTSSLRWLKGLSVEFVEGDVADRASIRGALAGTDYVFHLAGTIQALSKKEFYDINVEGTRHLLDAVVENKAHLKKFVLVSSQAAGGPSEGEKPVGEEDPPHPVSHYGESKLAAEKLTLQFAKELPLVVLRPPTIYGPRETRVYQAFQMMKKGIGLAVGRRHKFISVCYVGDLVKAILMAAFQSRPSGRVYNVAGEKPYEWVEFLNAMSHAMKHRYRLFRIPVPLLYLLGAGGELYSRLSRHSSLFTWQKVKEFVQHSWVIDGTKIRQELGWHEKTSLQEGMIKTTVWYRRAGWL